MAREKKPTKPTVFGLDPIAIAAEKAQRGELSKREEAKARQESSHLGAILDVLKKQEKETEHRMAFTVDPQQEAVGRHSIYKEKTNLTPDYILKHIAGPQGDDLVNQILQARSNILASFGRPRTSRFDVGFEFQDISSDIGQSDEEKETERKQIEQLKEVIWNCGHSGLDEEWAPNLSQFLKMITRDGLLFGRFAVERIYDNDTGRLHSFRPVDAGTIYRIVPTEENDKTRRKQAIQYLNQVQNKEIDADKYEKNEYKYVQVIHGKPVQVFTDKELVLYNLYPTTNVEFNGYPLTPIDQALNAVTTHINITIHNKMYFQNGRASRGMLVIQSDEIDESSLKKIRSQFTQSINSVNHAWRMPVFGVGTEDNISWQPIDNSGRDKEFQFLSDDTARVVLGAFQISPEELPGYAHLSRGSNSQTLSESDNEYKLTAARDVGLRPLISDIQDFLNNHIVCEFNKDLSRNNQLVLAGLEKDSPEKEATRLQQDMQIHLTMDNVFDQVEKETLGKQLGGEFPLNQIWQQSIAPYMTVGVIMENFFDVKGASQDPRYQYIRDPFWMQYQQVLTQKAQMAMQQQMMMQQQQQQEMMGGAQPEEGGEAEAPPAQEQLPPGASDEEQQQAQEEYQKSVKQWHAKNFMALSKSVSNTHNTISKAILKRHTEMVDRTMGSFVKESQQAVDEIKNALKGKSSESDRKTKK